MSRSPVPVFMAVVMTAITGFGESSGPDLDPMISSFLGLQKAYMEGVSRGMTEHERVEYLEAFMGLADLLGDSIHGARALTSAANISSVYMDDNPRAEALYREALERYEAHPEWADRPREEHDDLVPGTEIPYLMLRLGDLAAQRVSPEEAKEIWVDSFTEHPGSPFAAQAFWKVIETNRRLYDSETAWRVNHEFVQDHLFAYPGLPIEESMMMAWASSMSEGVSLHKIGAAEAAEAVSAILAQYPPGFSEYIDQQRDVLVGLEKAFINMVARQAHEAEPLVERAISGDEPGADPDQINAMRPGFQADEVVTAPLDATDNTNLQTQKEQPTGSTRFTAFHVLLTLVLLLAVVFFVLLAKSRDTAKTSERGGPPAA